MQNLTAQPVRAAGHHPARGQHHRVALDTMIDAYLAVDAHDVVVACNAAMERLLDSPRHELIGAPANSFIDTAAWNQELGRIEPNRLTFFAATILRRDGAEVPVEATVWASQDAGESLRHALCRRVTEASEASTEPSEQTRRLEEAQRIANVGSWDWDLVADHVTWSSQLYAIAGVEPDAPVRHGALLSRLHTDDSARVREAVGASLRAGGCHAFEARIVRSDGTQRWVACRGEVRLDSDGCAVRASGTVQDITERKTAEAARAAAETLFTTSFEHSPVGTFVYQPDGGILRANAAFGRLLGVEPARLLAMHPMDFPHLDDASIVNAWTELLSGQRNSLQAEGRLLRADGTVACVQAHAVTVPATDTAPGYILGHWHDITAWKTAAPPQQRDARGAAWLNTSDSRPHALPEPFDRADEQEGVAVLVVGIDGFDEMAGGLGADSGAILVQESMRRLMHGTRRGDVVVQLGPDRFVVLAPAPAQGDDAVATASGIRRCFEAPFDLGGVKVHVNANIGIAVAPRDSIDAAVLEDASVAMARAKALRCGWALSEGTTDAVASEQLGMAGALRAALETEQLDVAFQPLVDAVTSRPVSLEALARWNRTDHGSVPPDQFIPLAEQSGVIVPLTRMVLAKASVACAQWRAAGHDVSVAVNLSMQVMNETDPVALVREVLDETGLGPEHLVLEITESALASDVEQVPAVLDALSALGVSLAIDDFGTGYSAMSYLKHLPVTQLKVDRSFVRDIVTDATDLSIVRSVVRLAHTLQLTVVAEGVESADAMALLRHVGCDIVQGYGIARPMPAAQVPQWLERWQSDEHTEEPSSSPGDLLVVDDNATVRSMLAAKADRAGWKVRTAACGSAAIDEVNRAAPDVVILDQQMPGMSGVQTVPALRAAGFTGPVLLFTRFLSELIPANGVPLDVWPVSKANLEALFELLGAYKASHTH